MSSVYIVSEYGKLCADERNLMFKDKNGIESKIMAEDTDLLVMNGHVSLTGESLHLLAKKGISVYLLENGQVPNINIDFGSGKNGFLRQRQYRLLDDERKSLEIAKTLVAGKIRNELTFLNRIVRTSEKAEIKKLENSISRLKLYLKKSEKCKNKDQLRGTEGVAAKEYFDLFDFNIMPEWAEFKKRSTRPPETNVNSVLSYLYTILTFRVQNALEAAGLDTMCSNLHEMTYGKTSLAFDIVEEFRTPIADTLCCRVFNYGIMKAEDFEQRDGGVYLTKGGCEKIILAFENKMNSEIKHPLTGEPMSYLKIIFEQAVSYKRFIMEDEPYIPFLMK